MKKTTGLMIVAVVALAVVPLFVHAPVGEGDEPFAGADAKAEALITKINPGYKAWCSPLFEPPSGEIESLLFSLQAALGAGLIGFYFGRAYGRQRKKMAF